jgi:hypothetical protein
LTQDDQWYASRFAQCHRDIAKSDRRGAERHPKCVRGPVQTYRRILLVTPAGLTRQWQDELRQKFGMDDFLIYGQDFFIHDPRNWKLYDHVIGSVDRLKTEDHLQLLMDAGPWDLVVFDEAHRLSRRQWGRRLDASDRFHLAAELRKQTDALLLLHAPPGHAGQVPSSVGASSAGAA